MKITENWSIEIDENNCTLTFAEKRLRNKGKENEEEFIYKDEYYYPTIQTALKSFLNKEQEKAKDVAECIKITEETYKKIENLMRNN